MEKPQSKWSPGRRKGQASRQDYKGKSIDHKINLTVFGRVANHPLFYEVLQSVTLQSRLQRREETSRDDPESNFSGSNFSEVMLFPKRKTENADTEEFVSVKNEILRHVDPVLLEISYEMMVIAYEILADRRTRSIPDQLKAQVRGKMISDPIRFWIIRSHSELFDELKRPPSGQEIAARYADVSERFPITNPSVTDKGGKVPGEENLRKAVIDVDLWMLDEKFICAVSAAHEKLRSSHKRITGESIWYRLTQNRRERESIEKWSLSQFRERLPNLACNYHPKNPADEPLLGAWLFWLMMIGPPLHGLRYQIEGLTNSYLELESSNRTSHSAAGSVPEVGDQRPSVPPQVRLDVINSLTMTHNMLCEYELSGEKETPMTMERLIDSNYLLKEMVVKLNFKLVEAVAKSRGKALT